MVEINLENPIVDTKINLLRSEIKAADIHKFREKIQDSDVSSCCSALESHETDSPMSLFEMVCNMAFHDDFIRECIEIGCDTNKQNPKCGRRPISFAVETFHSKNLEALLSDTSVKLDNDQSFDFPFTPINYLLEHVSVDSDTFKKIYLCVELLVKHCADVNLPGKVEKTPIQNILTNDHLNEEQKKQLVKCIFDHAKYVDIDGDNGATRGQLKDLIPDLELPPLEINSKQETSLKDGDEIEFWKSFRINSAEKEPYWHLTLLDAVKRGLIYSVERIFRSGLITTMHSLDVKEPLHKIALRHIEWGDNGKPNNEKCLNLYLNHRKIDINAIDDSGRTALHNSIKRNFSYSTIKLLERGAYIGREDEWGDMEISDIQPQLLEKHFDCCITADNEHMNNTDLKLTFDYKNLIPLHCQITHSHQAIKYSEMKAIECIKNTRTLAHLFKHPLVEGFLDLKWNLLAFIFYTNFFFCTLFAALNIFYILIFFLEAVESPTFYKVGLMAFVGLMIARELIQLISSPCAYVKSYQNYLECILIGLSIYILVDNCPVTWRGNVAAITILLFAYEVSVLTGSLPIRSFAMNYVMLETVATNFFKALLSYSTIIFAFALAFLSLFHKKTNKMNSSTTEGTNAMNNSDATDDDATDDHESRYNNFQGISLSILKSLVMANGELDTSSIPFNDNPLSYIVFVAFMLIVTTVLGNLLGGLAVSDINEIRAQAELTYLFRRCEVLAQYERTFRGWLNWSGKMNGAYFNTRLYANTFLFQIIFYRNVLKLPKLDGFIRSRIYLYTDYRSKYQKTVFPNHRRTGLEKCRRYFKRIFCFDSNHGMEEGILKEALKIACLDKNEENDIEMLRNQISKLANSNESIQHEVGKTLKSVEKMLAELQSNIKRM